MKNKDISPSSPILIPQHKDLILSGQSSPSIIQPPNSPQSPATFVDRLSQKIREEIEKGRSH